MLISTDQWAGSDDFTRANVTAHEYTLHEWYPVATVAHSYPVMIVCVMELMSLCSINAILHLLR